MIIKTCRRDYLQNVYYLEKSENLGISFLLLKIRENHFHGILSILKKIFEILLLNLNFVSF